MRMKDMVSQISPTWNRKNVDVLAVWGSFIRQIENLVFIEDILVHSQLISKIHIHFS